MIYTKHAVPKHAVPKHVVPKHVMTAKHGLSLAAIAPLLAALTACVVTACVAGCGTAHDDDHDHSDHSHVLVDGHGSQDGAGQQTQLSGMSEAGHYHVALVLTPTTPAVATYFSLTAQITAADMATPATITSVVVDGWMPEHKHGMEGVKPETTLASDKIGQLATQGLFFNMPGQWQLRVKIKAGAHGPDTALLPIYVGP